MLNKKPTQSVLSSIQASTPAEGESLQEEPSASNRRRQAPIDLLSDLDRILGSSDEFLPVLRMRAVSSKYELKDRNKEIEDINESLFRL